jgi:LysM repeat protein
MSSRPLPKKPNAPRGGPARPSAPGASGKTLEQVADDHGVTVEALKMANPVLRTMLPKQSVPKMTLEKLKIPKSAEDTPLSATQSRAELRDQSPPPGLASNGSQRIERSDSANYRLPQSPTGEDASQSPKNAAPVAPPKKERLCIATVATRHEFSTAEIRQANPSIAHLSDEDPFPAGTKITLPKRTRPKMSTLVARLLADETAARGVLEADYDTSVDNCELRHDETLETIHLLAKATKARRLLVIADVVQSSNYDRVGLDGGATSDPDYLAADVDAMVRTMAAEAEMKDAQHWSRLSTQQRAKQGYPAASETAVNAGGGRASQRDDGAGSSTYVRDDEETMSMTVVESFDATSRTVDATGDQAIATVGSVTVPFAASPWGQLMPMLETAVREAIAGERQQLLEDNKGTLRALLTRKIKLGHLEDHINRRFDELFALQERLRRREVDLGFRSELLHFAGLESVEREALSTAELTSREGVIAAFSSALIATLHEAHRHRWEHQLRMAAGTRSPNASMSNAPSPSRGHVVSPQHLSVPSRKTVRTTSGADADGATPKSAGLQYIVIRDGDTPTVEPPSPSPDGDATHVTINGETTEVLTPKSARTDGDFSEDDAGIVRKGNQTPDLAAVPENFQLEGADDTTEEDPQTLLTDSLVTRQVTTAIPPTETVMLDSPRGGQHTTTPDSEDAEGHSPLKDQAASDGDAFNGSSSRDFNETRPPRALRRKSAAAAAQKKPGISAADTIDGPPPPPPDQHAQAARPLSSAVDNVEAAPPAVSAAEQEPKPPAATLQPTRDTASFFDNLPPAASATSKKIGEGDDYDCRIDGKRATHVGLSNDSRGRALLRVPLHRGVQESATLIFQLEQQPLPSNRGRLAGALPSTTSASRPLLTTSQVRQQRPKSVQLARSSIQLLAAVPLDASQPRRDAPLAFDAPLDSPFVAETHMLRTVARVNFPMPPNTACMSSQFQLTVDCRARTLVLRDADGDTVARDGLWSVEGQSADPSALCVAVTLVGCGTALHVLNL